MRDAFGGAFSIKLMLIFLMLYVSFMCVAINYARAFRVKNRIINIIEQYEGYNAYNQGTVDSLIDNYLNDTGYHVEYTDVSDVSSCTSLQGHGYCIVQMESNPEYPEYYKVETYMVFSLPIIDTFTGLSFPIRIQGETRRIEKLN